MKATTTTAKMMKATTATASMMRMRMMRMQPKTTPMQTLPLLLSTNHHQHFFFRRIFDQVEVEVQQVEVLVHLRLQGLIARALERQKRGGTRRAALLNLD